MNSELLARTIGGLSVEGWLELAAVWVAITAGFLLAKWFVVGRLEKLSVRTNNKIDDMIVVLIKGTRKIFLALVSVYLAAEFVTEDAPALPVIRRVVLLGALVQAGFWSNSLITFWSQWYINRESVDSSAQVTAVSAIGMIGRVLVWAVLVILALDNFGVDITALVAGLGIGGIAIALAVQNILQDILAYISIVVDKPFVHGDLLVVAEHTGTIEHIGIKTTRLRSLSGEQLIFSNTDLLGSRIRNYRRMHERRAVFEVGVTYDTPRALLEKIPGIVREIIEQQEDIRFDRSHLKSFSDFAIKFEAVYYMTRPEYALFMDRQQAINLGVHEAFEELSIEFAFPTQSIHIESLPTSESPAVIE